MSKELSMPQKACRGNHLDGQLGGRCPASFLQVRGTSLEVIKHVLLLVKRARVSPADAVLSSTSAVPHITLHYITLHYIALHYITLHYITHITHNTHITYVGATGHRRSCSSGSIVSPRARRASWKDTYGFCATLQALTKKEYTGLHMAVPYGEMVRMACTC
jgi:hypothetical protein